MTDSEKIESILNGLQSFGENMTLLKRQVAALEDRTFSLESSLNGQMTSLESSLNGQMTSLESNLNGQMTSLESSLNGRMTSLESSLNGQMTSLELSLNERMDSFESNLNGRMTSLESSLNERMTSLESDVKDIKQDVKLTNLIIENEIRKGINIIAEGHSDLTRKLDDALKVENEKEMVLVRLNVVESKVDTIMKRMSPA